MRTMIGALAVLLLSVTTGCSLHRAPTMSKNIPSVKGETRTAFALTYIDVVVGTGALLVARQCVYAHYTGRLLDGKIFDSSRDTMPNGKPKTPLSFPLGVRRVISGWDLGFDGMHVGGQRRLIIPYQLAYGEAGRMPTIPPKATLIFDVELMALSDTLPTVVPAVRPDSTSRRPVPAGPACPTWTAVSTTR